MNKKTILITIFCSILALILPVQLDAQTPTSTVAGEKIDQLREEVEKKVQEKLNEIINKQEKRGWVGTISKISTTGFQIGVDQETRSVTLNDEAKIINQNRQVIKFADLKVDQRIIAMGYEQIDGSLGARRIVIIGEREPRKIKSAFGVISEKAEQDEIILIKSGEKKYELIFDQNSILEQREEEEISEIDYDNLTADQKVVVVFSSTKGGTATYKVKKLLVLSSPEPTEAPSPTETADPQTLEE